MASPLSCRGCTCPAGRAGIGQPLLDPCMCLEGSFGTLKLLQWRPPARRTLASKLDTRADRGGMCDSMSKGCGDPEKEDEAAAEVTGSEEEQEEMVNVASLIFYYYSENSNLLRKNFDGNKIYEKYLIKYFFNLA